MKPFIVFILLKLVFFSFPFARADSPAYDISPTSVRNSFRFFTEADFSPHEISLKLDNSERAVWKISSLENNESKEARVVMNGTGFFVGGKSLHYEFSCYILYVKPAGQ